MKQNPLIVKQNHLLSRFLWKQTRLLSPLILLVLQWVLKEAVVRLTLRICIGAICKAGALTLVTTLFVPGEWTLRVFSQLLDITLIGFFIDIVIEMLEELGVPIRRWLNELYNWLRKPKDKRGEELDVVHVPQETGDQIEG